MRRLLACTADVGLIGFTSAYARWLDSNKDLEPDHTWLEVTIGIAACLVHALAHSAIRGGTWRDGQADVWRSLAIGSVPVIVGELDQARRRAEARARYQAQRQ